MLTFTAEERDQAAADLAQLGIQTKLGAVPDDAVALLGYVMTVLRYVLFLRPEAGTPSIRVALAMYAMFKAGDFPAPTVPATEPITAALGDVGFTDPSDRDLERVIAHLRSAA